MILTQAASRSSTSVRAACAGSLSVGHVVKTITKEDDSITICPCTYAFVLVLSLEAR
jgi:hypothetical protein